MDKIATEKKKYIWIVILLGIVLILILAFNNRLTIRTYEIISYKMTEGSSVRIVLLSDLHSTLFGNDQQPLISRIVSQNPDIILLAGDIMVDAIPNEPTRLFLEGIQDIAPIFYVTGNHEYWGTNSDNIHIIRSIIQSYNIKFLSNEFEQVYIDGNNLIIAGLEDTDKINAVSDYNHIESMQELFENLSGFDDYFKILLTHRPDNIELYSQHPFDLVVAGHTHGGQVRIPFIVNGLVAPGQGWFPRFAGGVYTLNELTLVVSRGLATYHPRIPRIFNPPEIVVIVLSHP